MSRGPFLVLLFLLTSCKSRLDELQESSAIVIFVMLIVSVVYLALTPKFQQWSFSKRLVQFFITRLASVVIFFMIAVGCLLLFSDKPIALLLALNFFISSAFLYRLKKNYADKSESERLVDFRYFTITLPSQLGLTFLLFDGLKSLAG